jgi:hypothetical protein
MLNSDDDIFMDINSQKYYVLLSGRWYTAPGLKGPWAFVASDKLPSDFGKIPEGSEKDDVLSSVSGTDASKEAVMDAQIPQTAKVDRKTATCTVVYDGEPKFEKIEGTSIELAMNTSSTVMKEGANYFCVENGVWFRSSSANGPWAASTERPKDTDKIPAGSSAYNTKYVYIYDSTPDVIYVGYTPGYMGCYVYGATVVYGTGYYYNPWYGPYYYPHHVTYGYSMHYNPWTGWSMGFHYSSGYFHVSVHGGGYWGPPMYRPPYHNPYHGGMYGRGPTYINGDVNINRDRTNNIYNQRNGVSTNDMKRGQNTPSTRDGRNTGQQGRNNASNQATRNNVYSDKSGNVYQQNDKGGWQQRDNKQWKDADRNNSSQLDQSSRQRNRSAQSNSSFQKTNRGGNMGGGFNRGGGGGGGRRR